MLAAGRFFFLLLLLVVDWVGDPHMGHSPLSRPLGSQEVVCQSLSSRRQVERALAATFSAPLACRAPGDGGVPLHVLPLQEDVPPLLRPGHRRIYVLLVLRR